MENPGTITYSSPGTYWLTYNATIDTSGFYLTEVHITSVDCSDIGIFGAGDPDIYFQLFDANGAVVYTSGHTSNLNPPITFSGLNLPLNLGPYSIGVFDSDSDTDDNCIDDSETGIPVGIHLPATGDAGPTTQTATAGSLTFTYTIEKQVTHYSDSVLIEVYESPDMEGALFNNGDTVLCLPEQNQIQLEVPNNPDLTFEWLFNGQTIQSGGNTHSATSGGNYQVVATHNTSGCLDSSNVVFIYEEQVPANFSVNGLELQGGTLNCTFQTASNYTWYVNGIYIPQTGSYQHSPLTAGSYFVVAETSMGCIDTSNVITIGSTSLVENEYGDVQMYPNPTSGEVVISVNGIMDRASISCTTTDGKNCTLTNIESISPSDCKISLSHLPSGFYILHGYVDGKPWVARLELIR